MTLLSLTAYAETHGVKKQSAAEWKTKGYLVLVGDKVDADASDERMKSCGKGRFRAKAHGGRRKAGVRGAIDRPALGYVGGKHAESLTPLPAEAWETWHALGNPNTMVTDLLRAIEADDEDAVTEALQTVQFSQWEEACTMAGWDRWPSDVAASIAAELGIPGREGDVLETIHRHVRARLISLAFDEADLTDVRLEAR